MRSLQRAFTLIELMIAVAIVGILAVIALPAYSNYHSKSKLAASFEELSAAKTLVETKLNDGAVVTDNASVGVTNTKNCAMVTAMVNGQGTVQCSVLNAPPAVSGATVTWTRQDNGGWACSTSGATDPSLAPKTCPQN